MIFLPLLFAMLSSRQLLAQLVGTQKPETQPKMAVQECGPGGCQTVQGTVTIDANWRWVHAATGTQNCYTGNSWDTTLCPDGATCAKNCAVDGADYQKTYGVSSTGTALTLNFLTTDIAPNYGSRLYFLGPDAKYHMFKLKNRQFSFDVDVSKLPCGLNGALYFSAMEADGGMARYPTNKAGAKYGTGYCDAQCPRDIKFIAGKANSDGWSSSQSDSNAGKGNMGACCPEMDIWEANSASQAFTAHTCVAKEPTACTGDQCGDSDATRHKGLCDKDGCDFASYRWGAKDLYGAGKKVDTGKPFTVVTQFVTADGTDTGALSEIRRSYVQGGKTIKNDPVSVAGTTSSALTDKLCAATKAFTGDPNDFQAKGGLKAMGDAMANGMVLVMSVWDDGAAKMQWLDGQYPPGKPQNAPGVLRGTCDPNSGDPNTVRQNGNGVSVQFSNIKASPIDNSGSKKRNRSTF